MPYVRPAAVISPKAHWTLIDVLLDRGEGDCAYALGSWDGERRIGFRWNGTSENALGNPQSRGLPTWTMLDPEIHRHVLELLPPDKLALARNFLGINLMIEGPAPPDNPQGDLLFFDFFRTPPVLVKLPTNALRDVVGRPTITDSECALLAMHHRRLITEIAAGLLAEGESRLREDGRFRLIEIREKQLQKFAHQLSTDVLAMAAAARLS